MDAEKGQEMVGKNGMVKNSVVEEMVGDLKKAAEHHVSLGQIRKKKQTKEVERDGKNHFPCGPANQASTFFINLLGMSQVANVSEIAQEGFPIHMRKIRQEKTKA